MVYLYILILFAIIVHIPHISVRLEEVCP